MPSSDMTVREAVVRLPATMSGLAEAGEALRAFLDTLNLDPSRRYHVELTFDEIAGNIVRHGQPVSSIELQIVVDDGEVLMTFDDDGIAFDPRMHESKRSVTVEQVGGLGLVLVKAYASRIEYERTRQHHNRLTLAIPLE
jgi:phosphoserine phosphatase RsbU/P